MHVPDLASEVRRNVAAALVEDLGSGDITAALVPEAAEARAHVITREDAVLCGCAWFEEVFRQLDSSVRVSWQVPEGSRLRTGSTICELVGKARPLLSGERTALNFLQLLSGVATRTRRYVDTVAGTRAKILDTRKTLPGLRSALKYAVRTGGGTNHRMGLYDGVLIKENHIAAAGGIAQALAAARALAPSLPIQIEVESLADLACAIENGARLILLDNFGVEMLREAVRVANGRAELEASGGITLDNLRAVAETGVDRISIGTLTKDIEAIDLSMRFL
ncbi:MAG TPA: carboxylating nicotinate-nucleotide diphosphorylase [Burkholderiales bacterium]|jgi:nicotinate-nucleotide pyrophosphorylase (carboxylating)|nr:carboxylating nicotinate-nucleotide diphosphorylase [Burkholderiales bacterium]